MISAGKALASAPREVSSDARFSSSVLDRATRANLAPALAQSLASSAPIPREAPVIRILFPFKLRFIIIPLVLASMATLNDMLIVNQLQAIFPRLFSASIDYKLVRKIDYLS